MPTTVLACSLSILLSAIFAAQTKEVVNPFDLLPQNELIPAAEKATNTEDGVGAEEESNAENQPQPEIAKESDLKAAKEFEDNSPQEKLTEPKLPAAVAQRLGPFRNAFLIEIDGPIFGQFHWYLNNRLDESKAFGADLVIIKLTTPGGDLEYSLQLARRLRDIDWATSVVYIPEEAISGGAIVSLGCDRIFMQQGALIGDAGPVQLGMQGFEHAEEKVLSYLTGALRELAESKGRPAAVAVAMSDRSLRIFQAKNKRTGTQFYFSEAECKDPEVLANYEIGPEIPESGQNRFLTVNAPRASELLMCEGVFDSEESMLQSLNIETLVRTRMNWVDRTVYLLNRPWLTGLLLIVGLIGLYFELAAPGISVAGLTAAACFGIFFWSHFLGGTSGWLEVILFGLGILGILCEIFVLPGFGVFGITGLSMVIVSLVMASQDFVLPESSSEWGELRTNTLIVLLSVAGALLLGFLQILILDSVPGLNRFKLQTPEDTNVETYSVSSLTATSAKAAKFRVGDQGIADCDLRPAGKALLNDSLVDVSTEGDYVNAGSNVEVIRIDGSLVIVRVVS